jgi:hypothetical protein
VRLSEELLVRAQAEMKIATHVVELILRALGSTP